MLGENPGSKLPEIDIVKYLDECYLPLPLHAMSSVLMEIGMPQDVIMLLSSDSVPIFEKRKCHQCHHGNRLRSGREPGPRPWPVPWR